MRKIKKITKYIALYIGIVFLAGCQWTAKKSYSSPKRAFSASIKEVDSIFEDELERLKELAQEEVVQEGDWKRIKTLLLDRQNSNIQNMGFYALPDGTCYTTSAAADKSVRNIKKSPYFSALKMGRHVMGALAVDKVTRRKSLIVAIPIMNKGRVNGFIGRALYMNSMWSHLKKKLDLPYSYNFFAVNKHGIIIFDLAKKNVFFTNIYKLRYSNFVYAVKKITARNKGQTSYAVAGNKFDVIYEKSRLMPWSYALSYPKVMRK